MLKLLLYFLLVNAVTLRRVLILSWELSHILIDSIWKDINALSSAFYTTSSFLSASISKMLQRTTLYFTFGLLFLGLSIGFSGLLSSDSITHILTAFICSSGPFILLLVPAVTYSNADLQEKQILQENKGKSGVYRWTNLVNGNSYIGSSVNLSTRLAHYYSDKYMETSLKKGKSAIYSSLKKYGLSHFSLEILEYSEPSEAVEKEQNFIDLLKPEYNILPTAGSSLDFQHSEETKTLMSEAKKGKTSPFFGKTHSEEAKGKISEAKKGKYLSEETKTKMSEAQKGENHPMFGKTHSEETLAKMSEAQKGVKNTMFGKTHSEETKAKLSAARKGKNHSEETIAKIRAALGQAVEVLDKETNETTTFSSGCQAAKALGCTEIMVRRYIKSKKLLKGRYLIEKKSAVQ